MPDPLATFGPYDLKALLGKGGMGVVHRARRRSDGVEVALKVLSPGAWSGAASRLRREAEAMRRIRHPNIASLVDAGEHEGRVYVALELIPGRTLESVLDGGPLGVSRAVTLVAKVARAIGVAHEVGVIHRDLKPSNIIVTNDDQPVVIDFGLARAEGTAHSLTATGEILGTLLYMPPEQLQGLRGVDERADIYALGAILHECLTGRTPFVGETTVELMRQVASDPALPPSRHASNVPGAVDAIVLRALAKSPADRHATAGALATDLERVLTGKGPETKRGPAVLVFAGALLAAGVGAAALGIGSRGSPPAVAPAVPPPREPPPPRPKPERGPWGWAMLAKAAGVASLDQIERMPIEEGTAYLTARIPALDAAAAALEEGREAELRPVVQRLASAFSVELHGKEPHAKVSPGLTLVEGGWGLRPEHDAFALLGPASQLRLHFELSKKPGRAIVRLAGYASGNDRGLDFSPVDITANGDPIALGWNPGFGGRNALYYEGAGAAFDATRFLRSGENDVEVRLTSVARTQFWVRRVEVLLGE